VSKVSKPAESSSDYNSFPAVIPKAVILSVNIPVIASMWREQTESLLFRPLAERVAVVGSIADHSLGAGPGPLRPLLGDPDFLVLRSSIKSA
jgi:hypothetical protein